MNIDEMIDEFRECKYDHFDEFYNLTKKAVFFSIAAIVTDNQDIDDLMQDTYIKFLENINKYKSKTSINAYLSTMARNIAINYYNKEKRLVHDEELFDFIPSEPTTTNDYESIEAIEMLKCLDNESKEIVVQHVLNDLKFKEIAKMLDKPLGTILWIYNKAIKKLKKEVGKNEQD